MVVMLSVAPLLLLGATMMSQAQNPPTPPAQQMSKIQFLIFRTGDAPPQKFSLAQMEAMQKAHLDNMQRLMDEGKMIIGGPVGKSDTMRGIAVLDLPDKASVEKAFATDPFLKEGVLKAEIYDWYCLKETMHRPKVMTDLKEYTIAFLVKGPNFEKPRTEEEGKKVQEGHMANIRAMAELGVLKVAGPIGPSGDIRGLFFFIETDHDKLKKLCDKDPAISSGRLKMDLYPLYMGKGSLGDK